MNKCSKAAIFSGLIFFLINYFFGPFSKLLRHTPSTSVYCGGGQTNKQKKKTRKKALDQIIGYEQKQPQMTKIFFRRAAGRV